MGVVEERNIFQTLTSNLARVEKQHQDVDVACFFIGLKLEYELARAHILCSFELSLS